VTFKLSKYNIKLSNDENMDKTYQGSINEDDSMMDVDDENDNINVQLRNIENKINNIEELKKFLDNENRRSLVPGYLISYQLSFLMNELTTLVQIKFN